MRRPICNYANCTKDICPIRVAIHSGNKKFLSRFCSRLHAGLWLLQQAKLHKESPSDT